MSEEKHIDEHSGQQTTGHEWDGIRELNTPLPKWWLWTFYATIIWAVGYWIAMPAIPLATDYTRGVLGYSQRQAVAEQLAAAKAERAVFAERIMATPLDQIETDPALLDFALAAAEAAFGDNCATCHGTGAGGSAGYPNLNDDDWLWGGTLEDIHTTLQYGIRSDHENTRFSEMPKFLTDGLLTDSDINDLVEYVLALSGRKHNALAAKHGAQLFQDNCAVCHGAEGKGSHEVGAPDLTDGIWLYGDSPSDIYNSIADMQGGVMPAWSGRLDPALIRSLAVYVHSLGGGV